MLKNCFYISTIGALFILSHSLNAHTNETQEAALIGAIRNIDSKAVARILKESKVCSYGTKYRLLEEAKRTTQFYEGFFNQENNLAENYKIGAGCFLGGATILGTELTKGSLTKEDKTIEEKCLLGASAGLLAIGSWFLIKDKFHPSHKQMRQARGIEKTIRDITVYKLI